MPRRYAGLGPSPVRTRIPSSRPLIHLRKREGLRVLEILYKYRIISSAASGETQDKGDKGDEILPQIERSRVLVRDPGYSPRTNYKRAIPYVIVLPYRR